MKRMRLAVTLLLLLGTGSAALAQSQATPPDVLVRKTTQEVLSLLRAEGEQIKGDSQAIFQLIRKEVLPHFDFRLMSRLVLARHWRGAPEAQRERFVEEFRQLLVRTYGSSLSKYSGQEIRYLPLQSSGSKDQRVTVETEILQPGGPPIPLDYKLHRTESGWKVYDVTVDGASLVLNYRSQFSSQIKRHGLDGLIQRLGERNSGSGGS